MADLLASQSPESESPVTPFSGLRAINLTGDLAGLADLLEIGFGATMDESGRAAIREMRSLSRSGWLAGAVYRLDGFFGGMQQGFVWIDQGRLVGNVSVTPAPYPRDMGRGAIVANVVVHPDYRGRGLARALMEAALALLRQQGYAFAILQVDPANETAHGLYARLGFHDERTFIRWQRAASQYAPYRAPNTPPITLRPANAWRAEYELARLVRPNQRGGLGWLRPTHADTFRVSLLKTFIAGFGAPAVEPLIIYRNPAVREQAGIIASARLHMAFGSADRLDLLVHPFEQGRLEDPLLNYVLRRLEDRRRPLIVEHPADDEVASAVLRKYHFEERRTDIHMRIDFIKQLSAEPKGT